MSLLELQNITKSYPKSQQWFGRSAQKSVVLDHLSLTIESGQILGLVGESGCGKSTLAKSVLRLTDLDSGKVIFAGEDITHKKQSQMTQVRKQLQMVFQDPYQSLNPRQQVGQILAEPLALHTALSKEDISAKVSRLLDMVGLNPKDKNYYPNQFSGGQRQRIGIARAISLEPKLVICDEPVSALDVSIQSQVLNLLLDLHQRLNLAYLFISHDLSVVRHLSDRVAVMYRGSLVELADVDALFSEPLHPYTQGLIAAVPRLGSKKGLIGGRLQGEVADDQGRSQGCCFVSRCPLATTECHQSRPPLNSRSANGSFHKVACFKVK